MIFVFCVQLLLENSVYFIIGGLGNETQPKSNPKPPAKYPSTNSTLERNKFKRWRQPIPHPSLLP